MGLPALALPPYLLSHDMIRLTESMLIGCTRTLEDPKGFKIRERENRVKAYCNTAGLFIIKMCPTDGPIPSI